MKKILGIALLMSAAVSLPAFVSVAQAGALDELIAVGQTSQEAVEAPTDEEAKDLSGQGFDTPQDDSDDDDSGDDDSGDDE